MELVSKEHEDEIQRPELRAVSILLIVELVSKEDAIQLTVLMNRSFNPSYRGIGI